LLKFYKNCKRIKGLCETRQGTIFKELFAPLYCGLLALSSAPHKTFYSECEKLDRQIVRHPREMPDALCIADREIILAHKSNIVFDKEWFEPTAGGKMRKLPDPQPVWTGYYPSSDREHPFVPLGLLIQSLYYHLGWRDPHIRDMHNFFEETGLRVDTSGTVRRWPYAVYSKPVQDEFRLRAKLTNGVRWSEWSVFYV
jgi:hypothetical protein